MARRKAHRRGVKRKPRKPSSVLFALVFIGGVLVGAGGYFLAEHFPTLISPSALVNLSEWLENAQGASVPILAVATGGEEEFGVAATLGVKVEPGEGYVYVGIDPTLVGFDFQDADRKAIEVAASHAGLQVDPTDGVGITGLDIKFLVVGSGEKIQIGAIDGPSAGAATTLALMAALENKKLKDGYVITGTIEEDGSIGQVGGVFYKAQAAHNIGATHMLVPPGQSVVTVYRQVTRQIGPFQWVSYVPETLDLNEYAQQENWNLQIVEVSNIDEAAALMLES